MAKIAYKEIKKQCGYIKKLWAEGMDDAHIRDLLKLSMKQWETRLEHIAKEEQANNGVVFLQYKTKAQRRYDQFEALSLTTESDKVRLDCLKEMKLIDKEIIELGQTLGVYPKAASSVNIKGELESKNLNLTAHTMLTDEERALYIRGIKIAAQERASRWTNNLTPEEVAKALEE